MKKILLYAGASLALIAVSATATYFVLSSRLSASSKTKIVVVTPLPSYTLGPTYTMQTSIVNLGDPGASRYIKIQIVLEFTPGLDKQSDVSSKVTQREVVLQDIVTTVLGTQTADGLLTAQGKENLKKELMSQFQPVLSDFHLQDILFPIFVIQ
jgi:flagellar basal body-associated protein FliL